MVIMTEKQIIEKAQFLIRDAERAGMSCSFLARWHQENALTLRELLESYVRLNTLERKSLRQTGMPLSELLSDPVDKPREPKEFREKYYRR